MRKTAPPTPQREPSAPEEKERREARPREEGGEAGGNEGREGREGREGGERKREEGRAEGEGRVVRVEARVSRAAVWWCERRKVEEAGRRESIVEVGKGAKERGREGGKEGRKVVGDAGVVYQWAVSVAARIYILCITTVQLHKQVEGRVRQARASGWECAQGVALATCLARNAGTSKRAAQERLRRWRVASGVHVSTTCRARIGRRSARPINARCSPRWRFPRLLAPVRWTRCAF